MIKYLFVAINSIALFLYGLFFDNGPSVKGNFPTSIKPGTEVTAELIVNKGSMGGFAKLQIEVPEGLSVKEGDSKGASFSFANGIGKWIWTGVPSDAEFTIKFTLVADASANGTKSIGAKYSYVENNNKQVIEMAPVEVTLGDAIINASEPTTPAVIAPTTPTESTVAKTETTPTVSAGDEPNSNVSVQRTITVGGPMGNDWLINLKIKKDAIKGFARYSDVLPEGFTAKEIKVSGSSFSVADGKVKFVWVNVPTEPEIEISYSINGTYKDNIMLEGEFSYLESNQSKFYKLTPEKLPESSTTATATETKTETPVAVTETKTPETKTETPVTETKTPETKTETPVTETAKSGSSVMYCVQIGAYTNPNVTSSKLAGMYGISEKIRSEMAGGFTKFMVGKHDEYSGARNHRETAKTKGVNGAFVAAYNGPSRITVQEALMISNQKWLR
jgi:cell division septation protein DedD